MMGAALDHRPERVLYIPPTGELYDVLGNFGKRVTPAEEKISGTKRKREKEDFCLRHLLIAWEKTDLLLRPLHICTHLKADYACYDQQNNFLFAIEITEAVQKEYAYALNNPLKILAENSQVTFLKTDPKLIGKLRSHEENNRYRAIVDREKRGWLGSEPENRIEDDIIAAIKLKIEKGRSGGYGNKPVLLVYDRSEASILCSDKSEIISHLLFQQKTEPLQEMNIFDQVHYLSGSKMFLDILNPYRNAKMLNVELREES